MNLRNFFFSGGNRCCSGTCMGAKAPEPYGLTPSARQVEWYNREMIAFFHFGINTFEEYVNEGDGRAPAAIFNPTALDCGQWMRTPSVGRYP